MNFFFFYKGTVRKVQSLGKGIGTVRKGKGYGKKVLSLGSVYGTVWKGLKGRQYR